MNKIYLVLFYLLLGLNLVASQRKSIDQVKYEKTAFFQAVEEFNNSALYIGAAEAIDQAIQDDTIQNNPRGAFALGKATVAVNPDSLKNELQILPLAPAEVTLNGAAQQTGPLFAKKITALSLFDDKLPVVVPEEAGGVSNKVYLVNDTSNGERILGVQDSVALNDAGGMPVTTAIPEIVANNSHIFVAVPAMTKNFGNNDGDQDRGIAVIVRGGSTADGLVPLDATDLEGEGTNTARKILVGAEDEMVAFVKDTKDAGSIKEATIQSNIVSMHWDNDLERLYVGLNMVSRSSDDNDNGKDAGLNSVLLGWIKTGATIAKKQSLELNSVIDELEVNQFDENERTNMVAAFVTEKGAWSVSTPQLKTIKTSTNKNYLIVNSVIDKGLVKIGPYGTIDKDNKFYALPLTSQEQAAFRKGSVVAVNDTTGIPIFSSNNNKFKAPTSAAEMPKNSHPPARLGGARHEKRHGDHLFDMFTVGDSVYTTFGGCEPEDQGIFKTTTLFNDEGFVLGWTPFERVMGQATIVKGAGLDIKTGHFFSLIERVDSTSLVTTTTWGLGDPELSNGLADSLGTQLSSIFCRCHQGGLHQLITFNEFTRGFNKGRFSMMVGLGLDKVALIQNGGVQSCKFLPITSFSTSSNICVIQDAVTKKVGPLTCAAIGVTSDASDNTYLYISGYRGIARLGPWTSTEDSADCTQGNGLLQLSDVGSKTFTQQLATSITGPVMALASGMNSLYVLEINKLHKINLDTNTIVASVDVSNGSDLVVARNVNNNDFVVVSSSNGIQVYKNDLTSPITVSGITGHGVQLQYLSQETECVPSVPGNIYALVFGPKFEESAEMQTTESSCLICTKDDPCKDDECKFAEQKEIVPQIYRIALERTGNNSVKVNVIDKNDAGNPRPYVQLDERRSNFTTDGSLLFTIHPRELDDLCDFVRFFPISCKTTSLELLAHERSVTSELDIEPDDEFNAAIVRRDTASGAWLVPGSWGVRVND